MPPAQLSREPKRLLQMAAPLVLLDGIENLEPRAPEGVVARAAHLIELSRHRRDERAPVLVVGLRPILHLGKIKARQRTARFFEVKQLPKRLDGTHAASRQRLIDCGGVCVELIAHASQRTQLILGIVDLRPTEIQGALELIEHRPLLRLVTVQLQDRITEAHFVQPALDHLQCRHLLGHEQYLAALAHGLGDDVSDGLRLAGAGRALDHEVATAVGVDDCQHLRRVGVDDAVHLIGRKVLVEVVVLCERWVGLAKPLTKQCA